MHFLESVTQFFNTHSIAPNQRILVAVSAGMDSMVLLHALHSLGQPVHVCHVHHGKRTESDAEEIFIRDWCAAQNIPVSVKRLNPKEMPAGANFQDWARQQRYAFFTEVAEAQNCHGIATAHHFNDKVETFFGHALRGSGLTGLSSLRGQEGKIIRPLLAISHTVLKYYALEHGLVWREDASNETDDYQRNRIRHHILPNLNTVHPQWEKGVKTTFQNLEDERALMASLVATWASKHTKKVNEETLINLAALKAEKGARALLYHLLAETDSGFNWHALANCPNDAVGSFYYGITHRALRDREWLIISKQFEKKNAEVWIEQETTHLQTPLKLLFLALKRDEGTNPKKGNATLEQPLVATDALLDYNKLNFPLLLRPWQQGDQFQPLGVKGSQLVSDFLINTKTPRSQKEKTMVLLSSNQIVWLVGHRISERFKVDANTQKMYLVRLLK